MFSKINQYVIFFHFHFRITMSTDVVSELTTSSTIPKSTKTHQNIPSNKRKDVVLSKKQKKKNKRLGKKI